MSSRPITLELASGPSAAPDVDGRAAALIGVVEDLVVLLEAQFPSSHEFPGDALRTRLKQARDRLRASDGADDVSGAGLRLVADASQAYARLSGHVSAREAEFFGVIRLLRELVDGLRGDAQAFRHDLMRSSERVADLTQIEDIRTLRRALNREVDQLRQCVQHGERREATRLAQVAGDLKKVDDAMAAQGGESRDRGPGLLPRPALLADIAAAGQPAVLVVCRIDEPEAIVEGHGAQVLERVIVALAHLLRGTFGKDVKVYRSSTQCVAMVLPHALAKTVAQQVRQVQARVAPEYEYERNGVTRRVVFTFSGAVAISTGKAGTDTADALTRAESLVTSSAALSQLHVESTGFGRLVGWLSS